MHHPPATRKPWPQALLCASLAACALFAAPASAHFKCVNAAGKTMYQDTPCPAGTQPVTRASKAPAPAPEAAKAAAPQKLQPMRGGPNAGDSSADTAILPLVAQQALFDICSSAHPDRYLEAHKLWRAQRQEALEQYEKSGRFQELRRKAGQQAQEQWSLAGAEAKADYCKGQALQMLEQQLK